MSGGFRSEYDFSFDAEELRRIRAMDRERLELDIESLSEARSEDKKYIQQLERELRNCSQEIGYLQEQLNLRNMEVNYLGEHVHSLELKLAEVGNLHEEVSRWKEELLRSNSECLFLMQELENKEAELRNSTLCIEKLEESISSVALESQCEIESLKLDMISRDQSCFEAKEFEGEAIEEQSRVNDLVEEFEPQFMDSQKILECLEKENHELKEKMRESEKNTRMFCQKFEEYLEKWLENKNRSRYSIQSCFKELEIQHPVPSNMPNDIREAGLDQLLSKLAVITSLDEDINREMEKMSLQIHTSDLLVKQLKEELKEEKLKAKDEAEDLTQEMAELRYQITGMLEEECKRRACIEQASLQRIAELEAQVRTEQKKSFVTVRHFHETQNIAKSRSMQVHLNDLFEGLQINMERNEVCRCGGCPISKSASIDYLTRGA